VKSTWIGDPVVEYALLTAFNDANRIFSTFFEANSLSNEERLTGALAQVLVAQTTAINNVLSVWSRTLTSSPVYIKLYYKDVTIDRGEKTLGADMAFVLDVRVPRRIEFKKAILLQAKKMQSSKRRNDVVFENHWRIDIPQAEKMRSLTSSSFHIFYNPFIGLGVRVLPTSSLISISKAVGNSSLLSTADVVPSTREFADFILYDFIGCWVGDFEPRILKIAEGSDEEISPNHIIWIEISSEEGVSQK
jgi:hypothetical protein